jgi:mannose/fructose/N-acetylgalactosamine-specific phosphotransferase system component IIC
MKKEAAFGALMVAYTMKRRFLIIGGAILLAIGFIGAIPFGSIVINEAAQQELDPTTQRPEPIFFGIISPLYAEMTFMAIGVVGFSLLVLGVAMHQEEESKQLRQKQQKQQR